MKMIYKHPSLRYHNPISGEYDENEKINPRGELLVDCSYEVCYDCGGHGKHSRRDIDESKLYESMVEDGDYDGIEAYYKGAYDCLCGTCGGLRVIRNPILPEWAEKHICDYIQAGIRDREYSNAELRAGA